MMSPEQKIWDSAIQLEYEQGSILNLMIICLGIGVHFTAWTDICSCNICIHHIHVDYAGAA